MNFLQINTKFGYYHFYRDGDTYYVTHTNRDRIRTIKEEDVQVLFTYIFSSSMRYSHVENGYHIYIDEMNNKRYLKDGKEDLIQFILNNGTTTVENSGTTTYEDIGKIITLKIKKDVVTMLLTISETAALLSGTLAFNNQFMRYDPYIPIQTDDVLHLIDQSHCLTEEEKAYFKNDFFIKDMLRYASYSRSEELKKRLTELGILYFTDEELKDETREGYYNHFKRNNKLHIRDEDTFYEAAAHEYAHLFQCPPGEYNYIREPAAEMIAHEYFDVRDSFCYYEEIKNLSLLMEVIGPQPVLESCLVDYNTNFENAIGEYLDEEDKEKLLAAFRERVSSADNVTIRKYILKMIQEKAKRHPELEYLKYDLEGDERITSRRSYFFNQHAQEYYRGSETFRQTYGVEEDLNINRLDNLTYCINESTTLDQLKELYESGDIKKYDYISVKHFTDNGYHTDVAYTKPFHSDQFSEICPKDFDTFYDHYIKGFSNIMEIELVNRNTLTNKDDIVQELTHFGHNNHSDYRTQFSDDSIHIIYKSQDELKTLNYETGYIPMPSVRDLFPEQCHISEMDQMFDDHENVSISMMRDSNGTVHVTETTYHGDGTMTVKTTTKQSSK